MFYVYILASRTSAAEREMQLKDWLCVKKLKLFETMNPSWCDLNREIGLGDSSSSLRLSSE